MRARVAAIACIAGAGCLYLGAPYAVLFRLNQAARTGNVATLETLVDWDAVRESLKEDICDAALDTPAAQARPAAAANVLPPFGASFMAGIADNLVDETVTPEGLVAMLRQHPAASGAPGAYQVDWAFFDGPGSFVVRLGRAGAASGVSAMVIHLQLRHGTWRVVRADLPQTLLAGMRSRT